MSAKRRSLGIGARQSPFAQDSKTEAIWWGSPIRDTILHATLFLSFKQNWVVMAFDEVAMAESTNAELQRETDWTDSYHCNYQCTCEDGSIKD